MKHDERCQVMRDMLSVKGWCFYEIRMEKAGKSAL